MSQIKLSVIIPVYNTSPYIRKCLDSVISQDIPDMEVLLIDDGSTDNSAKICMSYASENTQVKYYYKRNGGLSSARNFGLDIAKGDLITFVDSDDFLEPNTYFSLLSEIGDCDAIVYGSKIVDEKGRIISIDAFESKELKNDTIITEIVIKLKTAVWNKIFKRDFINNIRFPENRIHGEDLVFILDCLSSLSCFKTSRKIGYNYVKHPGSITTSGFSESSLDEIWCKDKATEILISKFGNRYHRSCDNWRFRARLNIYRKLVLAGADAYNATLRQLLSELKRIYKDNPDIDLMNRIEFIFLNHLPTLYYYFLKYK